MKTKIIDVKEVSKKFNGVTVVDKVTLSVEQGDIYGFLGPNGSGKTTTIRMICGLLPIDGGEGTCLGYDIGKAQRQIKEQVGYMTQKFSLYGDLTVEENLAFYARLFNVQDRKESIQKIIDLLKIGNQRKKQLAKNLSGGWKQRLALGAAIIHQPKLLLLDEPTAGVDPKARREFWDEIFRLSDQGITTLVSTHYMDEAERCNKLAYISYGKLLVSGTTQHVIDSVDMTTWKIEGNNLNALLQALEKEKDICQAAAFGRCIHVSTRTNSNIEHIIEEYGNKYKWEKISTQLEDVFIELMNRNKDNFS